MSHQETIQTVQQTSKKWKTLVLLGWVLCFFGGMTALTLGGEGDGGAISVGGGLFVAGVVSWIVGKVGKYWNHS